MYADIISFHYFAVKSGINQVIIKAGMETVNNKSEMEDVTDSPVKPGADITLTIIFV